MASQLAYHNGTAYTCKRYLSDSSDLQRAIRQTGQQTCRPVCRGLTRALFFTKTMKLTAHVMFCDFTPVHVFRNQFPHTVSSV